MTSAVLPDLLPSIGSVSVNYRLLEMYIEMGIWKLLGDEKIQNVGKIVTSELNVLKLINLIGSLHTELCKDSKLREEFQDLLKEIDEVRIKRNKIIHEIAGTGKSGNAIMLTKRVKNPKGLKQKVYHISKEEIEKVADSISELSFRLISFVSKKDFLTS